MVNIIVEAHNGDDTLSTFAKYSKYNWLSA
jgi:hypothetical protein